MGNQEVLGSLVSNQSQQGQINGRVELIYDSEGTPLFFDQEYTEIKSESGAERFEFDSSSINFSTTDGANERIETSSSDASGDVVISFTKIFPLLNENIIYLDMRHNVVAYQVLGIEEEVMGTQSSGSDYVETLSQLIYFEEIFKSNGVNKSTTRFNDVDFSGSGTNKSFRVVDPNSISCDFSTTSNSRRDGTVIPASTPVTAATDVSGNTAISFKVPRSDGSFDGIHVVGDTELSTLFPGAPDNATYDIRLIK